MATTSDGRIKLRCTNCQGQLAVPAKAIGRAVRCPKCQTKLRVPEPNSARAGAESPTAKQQPQAASDHIRVACEGCGKSLRVPAASSGKRVRCPACGTAFAVAAAQADSDDDLLGTAGDDDVLQQLAGGQAVAPSPEDQAARAAAAGQLCRSCQGAMPVGTTVCPHCGHDSAPKAKKPAGPRKGLPLPKLNLSNLSAVFERRIARLWLGLMILGGVLIFMGIRETRLNAVAKAEPQRISCAQLESRGPGDNAHVLMTDFIMCDFYVYEEGVGSRWERAWVPVVPLGGEYHRQLLELTGPNGEIEGELPPPPDFKVIIEFPGATDEEYLSEMAAEDEIHGTIVNVIRKLDPETKKLIEGTYDVDADACWVLVEGRTPGGSSRVWSYMGGGVILILFGGFMLLRMASE